MEHSESRVLTGAEKKGAKDTVECYSEGRGLQGEKGLVLVVGGEGNQEEQDPVKKKNTCDRSLGEHPNRRRKQNSAEPK